MTPDDQHAQPSGRLRTLHACVKPGVVRSTLRGHGPRQVASATDEPSPRELAQRLLGELDRPGLNDASRLEAVTAALTSVAWQVKRERARRHHEVLRALLCNLFPEHDFAGEPDERLVPTAIAKMAGLRSSLSACEARALSLSDALTAMQDVLSAIASLRGRS